MIVKTTVQSEFALKAMLAHNVYLKEMAFYGKIAPKYKDALARLNDTDQLVAEPYGVCSMHNAILLEDLSIKGYDIAPAVRGLNFNQTKLVLEKIAKFHAINAVLQQEDPDDFLSFKYGKGIGVIIENSISPPKKQFFF